MAETFEPPPTFADVVLVQKKQVGGQEFTHAQFNPIWLKWFLDLANYISLNGAGGAIQHNTLGGLQGGQANEYYHLTAAEEGLLANAQNANQVLAGPASGSAALPAYRVLVPADMSGGYSGTITTAKLTGTGANGSMTFTNGVLTAQTPAT